MNTKLLIPNLVFEMAYSVEKIDKVRAMTFPAGTLRYGELVSLSGIILGSWKSDETDKLFQVYVNGQWAGATSHPHQRMLLVPYEHTHTAALEVIAVEPEERNIDFSDKLKGFTSNDGSHAILTWPKRGVIPLGSQANVYWNSGEGEIDYSEPLITKDIWSSPINKWGWGLDAFGKGDFSYSGTGAIGWERGSFGLGEFGFDAELQKFQSNVLPIGTYMFAVRLRDELGNLDEGEITTVSISVDPLPAAPSVKIDNYDEQSDTLTLSIDES